MTEQGLVARLDAMIEDARDANKAREQSEHGPVERCACGAYTVRAPCPKCRREAEQNDKG